MAGMGRFAREFWDFLWARKLWWMAPMLLVLVLLGGLLYFAEGTPAAPFVYTLF